FPDVLRKCQSKMAEGSGDPEGEESSEWFLPPPQIYLLSARLNTPELQIAHARSSVFSPLTCVCLLVCPFRKGEAQEMSYMAALIERGKNVLVGNYARIPIVMARGEGALLWDGAGKRYLDLFAGFGGAVLGHCHPALVEAATQQAKKLWHVGNTFYTEPQIEVAQRLNKTAFTGQAFFCHSGLEANEAAVKLSRLKGRESNPRRWKTITLNKSFHGRSLAMIAATANPKIKAG